MSDAMKTPRRPVVELPGLWVFPDALPASLPALGDHTHLNVSSVIITSTSTSRPYLSPQKAHLARLLDAFTEQYPDRSVAGLHLSKNSVEIISLSTAPLPHSPSQAPGEGSSAALDYLDIPSVLADPVSDPADSSAEMPSLSRVRTLVLNSTFSDPAPLLGVLGQAASNELSFDELHPALHRAAAPLRDPSEPPVPHTYRALGVTDTPPPDLSSGYISLSIDCFFQPLYSFLEIFSPTSAPFEEDADRYSSLHYELSTWINESLRAEITSLPPLELSIREMAAKLLSELGDWRAALSIAQTTLS